jgi:transcriptional regulator with PAS, ATPase and Fis domain
MTTKEKLIAVFSAGRELVDEKKAGLAKTQELVSKAAVETCATTTAITDQLSNTNRDEGILFLDFQGTVLHANQIAHKVLGCEANSLVGQTVNHLLSEEASLCSSCTVQKCSLGLYGAITGKAYALPQTVELSKYFGFCIDSLMVYVNVPCEIPFKGSTLTVKVTLLDAMPATLDDVTYILKLHKT